MEFNGYPEDIAFRDSSTTWVALRDGGVHRVAFANGDVDSVRAEIGRAVSIADDPGHGCWVADREGGVVLYISDDLSSVSSLPGLLVKPIDLEFIGDGLCWVVDNAEQKLILLNRQCESIEIREDMGAVSGVAYDPNTESLWVTRSSDGEVDRYRSDGSTTTISLPGCPRIIEGDWLGLVR